MTIKKTAIGKSASTPVNKTAPAKKAPVKKTAAKKTPKQVEVVLPPTKDNLWMKGLETVFISKTIKGGVARAVILVLLTAWIL